MATLERVTFTLTKADIIRARLVPYYQSGLGIGGQAVKKLLVPITYSFTTSGIGLDTGSLVGTLEWAEVRRAYESSRFFVFTTPGALQIVPKRALDASQQASLVDLVSSAIGKRSKFRRQTRGTA